MFDPFASALSSLWPLLLFLVGVAALRMYLEVRTPSRADKGRIDVRARPDFFTASELTFHKTLTGATSGRPVAVYPKVRVLDLVEPRPGGNYQTSLNKLRGQYVDWLLVSLPAFKPLVAIELDGSSHQRERQRNADRNKDEALSQVGLPLVRVSTRAMPDVTAVRTLLAPYVGPTEPPVPQPVMTPQPDGPRYGRG